MKSMPTARSKKTAYQRGSVFIEAAISLSVFSLILFTAINMFVALWRMTLIDHALARTARYAVTLPTNTPSPLLRVTPIKDKLALEAQQLGISLTANDIFICPVDDASNTVTPDCANQNAGMPDRYLSISAHLPIVFPPFMNFNYVVTVVGRNEPV